MLAAFFKIIFLFILPILFLIFLNLLKLVFDHIVFFSLHASMCAFRAFCWCVACILVFIYFAHSEPQLYFFVYICKIFSISLAITSINIYISKAFGIQYLVLRLNSWFHSVCILLLHNFPHKPFFFVNFAKVCKWLFPLKLTSFWVNISYNYKLMVETGLVELLRPEYTHSGLTICFILWSVHTF